MLAYYRMFCYDIVTFIVYPSARLVARRIRKCFVAMLLPFLVILLLIWLFGKKLLWDVVAFKVDQRPRFLA